MVHTAIVKKKQPPEVFRKKKCSKKFRKIPATLLKRDSGTGVFLCILRNFPEQLFHRTPLDDCYNESLVIHYHPCPKKT